MAAAAVAPAFHATLAGPRLARIPCSGTVAGSIVHALGMQPHAQDALFTVIGLLVPRPVASGAPEIYYLLQALLPPFRVVSLASRPVMNNGTGSGANDHLDVACQVLAVLETDQDLASPQSHWYRLFWIWLHQ